MKTRLMRANLLILAGMIPCAATTSALAGTIWDGEGANANINTPVNWNGDTLPSGFPATSGTLTFATGLSSGDPLINVNLGVTGFIFNASNAVTLANPSNNTITIGGGGIQVSSDFVHTIAGPVALSSNASFRATTSSLPASGIRLTGSLQGSTNNLTTVANNPFLIDLSSAGAATGSGTTTMLSQVRLRLSNTNQIFSGNLALNGGVLEWAGTGEFNRAFGSGAGQVSMASGSGGGFAAIGADRTVNLGGNATPDDFTLFATTAPLIFGSPAADGMLIFRNPISPNGTGNGDLRIVTVDGPAAIEAQLTGSLKVGGAGFGTSDSLTFRGDGVIRLSAVNSIDPARVHVSGGTVLVDSNDALGSAAGSISMARVFGANLGDTADAAVLTNGAMTITRGFVLRQATGFTNRAILGGYTADNSAFSSNVTLGFSTNEMKDLTVSAVSGGQVTFSGVIDEVAGTSLIGNVEKIGAGKVIFSNANAYNGTTTINNGTLVANNNAAFSSGAITVNSGGRLEVAATRTITNSITVASNGAIGGNGTFNPAAGVTLTSGAHLSPGSSIGTLTIGSNGLTLNNGSIYDWEWTSTSQDLTNVNGLLTLSGAITLNVAKFGAGLDPSATPTNYVLMNYSTVSNGATWNLILPVNWQASGVSVGGGQVVLQGLFLPGVPEPATLSLWLAGGGLALLRRRRT